MRDLAENIAELEKRGPITIEESLRMEGPIPSLPLVKATLLQMSGEDGWDANRFFCSALEKCGSHPDEGHSSHLVQAYENVRQLLVASKGDRVVFETLLAG